MKKRMVIGCFVGSALALASSAFADTTYSAGGEGWGGALTVASGETVILEAAADAETEWAGTLTVQNGGVVKTTGKLKVSGNTAVDAGGKLDVTAGEAWFNFGAQAIRGDFYIRSGARVDINRTDALNYGGSDTLHIWGTFNCGAYRQSFGANNRLYLYDGAQVLGVGDGEGGFDFFADGGRMTIQGTSTIEPFVKLRNSGQTINLASHEGATVVFAGGLRGGAVLNQIPATAEEGNTAGTCTTAAVVVGPNPTFTGGINLSSAGANKVIFAANPTYPITCGEGAALTVESTAEATLPAITTGGSVTLTGTGPALLPAAVSYPITVAGALKVAAPAVMDATLSFADGGSLTLVPVAGQTLLTVRGGVTASGSDIPLVADARANDPGTYSLVAGMTSLASFATTALPPAGGSASLTLTDGTLMMTAAGSSLESALTWRPTDAADLQWNTTSLNWLLDDGSASGFIAGLETRLDGNETVAGDIVIDELYRPGPLSITGARDYVFTGSGALDGKAPITIDMTGTVTLDGPNLGGQDVTVNGGTLKIGDNAGGYALGTTNGTLTVGGTGVLDLNYISETTTDVRNRISHRKLITLKDGGTILSGPRDSTSGILGQIVVEGSGTIAGTNRVDVRNTNHDPDCTTTSITGDENAVLNIANSNVTGINGATINIGRIDVKSGGWMRKESQNGTEVIPHGIHVENGGYLSYWNSKTDPGVTVFVDAGTAELGGESSTSYLKGPLVIAEGATVRTRGGGTLDIDGGVQNGGVFESAAGLIRVRSRLSDDFTLKMTGGTFNVEGSGSGTTLNALDMTDGSLAFSVYGNQNEGNTMANFDTVNVKKTAGNIDVLPQLANIVSDSPAVVNVESTGGRIFVYGPTNTAEYVAKMQIRGSEAGRLSIGVDKGRAGKLFLKEGSNLEVNELMVGDNGSGPSRGCLVVEPGAKVTVTGILRNGHWSGTPPRTSEHEIVVAGELDAAALTVGNPWDAPRAKMFVQAGGVFKAAGLYTRSNFAYGNGVGAGEGKQFFKLDGGRLELGAAGLTGNCVPGVQRYDFAAGELVSTAAWGMNQGIIAFFGHDEKDREVTFDLGGSLVNWNTGLSGTSAVTLKGHANFQGARADDRMQGALLGKFTVENTGTNDLTNAGYFGGGLELADGTRARVANYGDEYWAFTVGGNNIDNTAATVWSYPYASAAAWDFIHRHFGSNPRADNTGYAMRGEFYVEADKAGPWTFAGNYDDNIAFHVDGAQVFKTTGWQNAQANTVTLTAGWHAFTIAVYDGNGGMGPGQATWKDGLSIGYLVGESTSTDSANYTKFSPEFLQMRPAPNAAIWSWENGNANWDTTEDWAHIKPVRSVEILHKHEKLPDADDWKPWCSSKVNRLQGWFKVGTDQVGEWNFKMGYDDNKLLDIDGDRVVNTTAWNVTATGKKTLDAGWHRWEVRLQDGSGGWGPSAANNGNGLSFTVPGGEEKQWNEDNVTLAATLGDIQIIEGTQLAGTTTVGAGATLTSVGTQAMPITGTLAGSGALAGDFAFKGAQSCWRVAGSGRTKALERKTSFDTTGAALFGGLKAIEVAFDQRPVCATYVLAPAGDFPATDAEKIAVTADVPVNGYANAFKATVRDGNLVLLNAKPSGLAIILQ